ncbi:MAG: flagellar basal body rod C-terminal domain-containing protein, partial [Enterobacteriaceae bacterium]
RNGAIQVDDQGRATINGLPVVGETGPVILPPFSSVSIGNDGTITIIPEDGDMKAPMDVDRLKLVTIAPRNLSKNADGYLVATRGRARADDSVQLVSGHLETSNVSAINEMVSTVSLNRQFEAQIKMMKAAEGLAQAGNRLIRGA